MPELMIVAWLAIGVTGLLGGATAVRVAAWRMRKASPVPAPRAVSEILTSV